MMGQPTPGVPMYTVKSVAGGRTRSFIGTYYYPCKGESDRKMG